MSVFCQSLLFLTCGAQIFSTLGRGTSNSLATEPPNRSFILLQFLLLTMAHISAFRALRYDPARASLSQVATQPYDKITAEMREGYYAASPYNLVRIILGKPGPADQEKDNVYTRAAGFFADWRQEGVFLQDAEPSIYRYLQRFTAPGSKNEQVRSGFIALGRLEDYSAGVVHRHEQTLAKPKADRLDLLRHTRAHFGQIFMLYSDPGGEIEGALATPKKADMEMHDEYGVLHQVWKVSDPQLVDLAQRKMLDKKLIIADGHHRYETALTYRNERRAASPPKVGSMGSEAAPYEFAMMTFVNMDSPGLVILPTHRVVHGLPSFSADALREGAQAHFSVEEVDPALDAVRANAILKEAGNTGTALLGITANRAFLFDRPKGDSATVFGNLSLRQQSLDVVQLHKCLLEGALGLSEESIRNQENLTYIRDSGQAIARVREGKANVAFLMNSARMQQIRDIAFGNEVLPQKSTDFYPKLLSGLTIYALE
jgi:uncharacterized protein (DUF1015 family)